MLVELQRQNLYDMTTDQDQEDDKFKDDCDVLSLGER